MKAISEDFERGKHHAGRPVNNPELKRRSNTGSISDRKDRQFRSACIWLLACGTQPALLPRRPGVSNVSQLWRSAAIQSGQLGNAGEVLLPELVHRITQIILRNLWIYLVAV